MASRSTRAIPSSSPRSDRGETYKYLSRRSDSTYDLDLLDNETVKEICHLHGVTLNKSDPEQFPQIGQGRALQIPEPPQRLDLRPRPPRQRDGEGDLPPSWRHAQQERSRAVPPDRTGASPTNT